MEWLTISEITSRTGIPESSVRRYTTSFGGFIESKTYGRNKKYSSDSIDILQRICSMYNEKKTSQEIKEVLSNEIDEIIDFGLPAKTPTKLEAFNQIAAVLERFTQQEQEIHFLKEELNQLKEDQRTRSKSIMDQIQEVDRQRIIDIEKRDNELMERMQLMLPQERIPWYKRWFK